MAVVVGMLAACSSTVTVRRETEERHDYPAGVAQLRWRSSIHEHPVSESHPEECASPVLVGSRLVLGTRGGKVVGVDTSAGGIAWSTPVTGGIDGDARFDRGRGQVYVGSDDGYLYAVDPSSGSIRWSSKLKGPVDHAPDIGEAGLFVATAADRVYAVDPEGGRVRWQYERETPDGFTIHGYAVPKQSGNLVYAGFSDGYLVGLRVDNGELAWSRSLAAASEQFVDVDASPRVSKAGVLYAASFSGGIYGLRPKDGEVLWHAMIEGTSSLMLSPTMQTLFAVSSRDGLCALSLEGNVLWRQGLPDAGDLTAPVEAGPFLLFSGSREGLFVVERRTGKLLQIFDPARGVCAPPIVDEAGKTAYVLANNGTLYALDLLY